MSNQAEQRRRAIWREISKRRQDNLPPPTLRELMPVAGIPSTSQIRQALEMMERQGIIKYMPRIARGIVLLRDFVE